MKNKIIKILVTAFSVLLFMFTGVSSQEVQSADYDGYLVTLKSGADLSAVSLMSPEMADVVLSAEELCEVLDNAFNEVTSSIPEFGVVRVEDKETLEYLEQCGLVEKSEPNVYYYLQGYDYSKNTFFAKQWGHTAINSSYAWQTGTFGSGVRVAVIDSGVYPNVDIIDNLVSGRNYIADSNGKLDSSATSDEQGHGTFVAGIIAASCNNRGTVGLAHKATIVPFKVTNGKTLTLENASKAITDAVKDFDCDVLNLSFGSPTPSDVLYTAVSYAVSNGAIVVAAAGNGFSESDGTTNYTGLVYPASYDNVISVSNVAQADDGYTVSSSSQHNEKVNVAAPGSSVCSLSNSESGARIGSGTSYACPYVAAAAAIVKSVSPETTFRDFNLGLKMTSDKSYVTDKQGTEYWGYGLLDVKALLKLFLADKDADFYVSSPDKQSDKNNTSIYITNLKSEQRKIGNIAMFTQTEENGVLRLGNIKWIPVTLGADQSTEISFNANGMSGNVKYTFISDNLRPLFKSVKSVSVD